MLHVRSPIEGFAGLVKPGYWDALVIQLIGQACHDAILQADCPVILIDPRPEVFPTHDRLELDHGAVGRMAARHLLETGRKNFAVLGFDHAKGSERREEAFVKVIKGAGFACPVLRVPVVFGHPRTRVGDASLPEIRDFIRSVPTPGAIFCGNDELARVLVEAAHDSGIEVPEGLAVLGADDDDLLCLTCTPTISSVRVPFHIAGGKAAQMVQKRWRGRFSGQLKVTIPPAEVVMRDSTRVVSGEDRLVEEVMRRMHQGFGEDLKMEDLAGAVGLSISTLERRFKNALGVPPMQELRRLRIHEAKRLLAETNLPVGKIAQQCGFRSSTRFCLVFREETGGTPGDYRQVHKPGATAR